jgi:hypothetical protein
MPPASFGWLTPRSELSGCGYSSMVEPQPSKLKTRVRFPLPAPSYARVSEGRCPPKPWRRRAVHPIRELRMADASGPHGERRRHACLRPSRSRDLLSVR